MDFALPSGIKPLSHQVAGHFYGQDDRKLGFLECDDGTILKAVQDPPRGQRELDFYQDVFDAGCTNTVLLRLRDFLPAYRGIVHLPMHPEITYFRLNDVTKMFKHPCILDVKVGPVTYDPLASAEKIAKEKAKYPPVEKTGFQLIGARVYRPERGEYQMFKKIYLRTLDEDELLWKGLAEFLNHQYNQYKPVVRAFLSRLRSLKDWFEWQSELHFYSSSLLLVYDAADIDTTSADSANSALKSCSGPLVPHTQSIGCEQGSDVLSQGLCNEPVGCPNGVKNVCVECCSKGCQPVSSLQPNVSVNMIDFAHVFQSDCHDSNYLKGLDGLIRYLERLL